MTFRIPWDETTPPGSAPADTIDDGIRDVKIAIGERLDQLLDWRDDTVDPKRFPGWKVTLDDFAGIVLAANTIETVTWTTPLRDAVGFITVPNTDVSIPLRQSGLYMVGVTIGWNNSGGFPGPDHVDVNLQLNGVSVRLSRQSEVATSISRIFTVISLKELDDLSVDVSHNIPLIPGGATSYGVEPAATTKWWGIKLGGF